MKRFCAVLVLVLLMHTNASAGFWDFLNLSGNSTKQDANAGPPKALFGGKMMNGAELLGELRLIKACFSTPSPMNSLSLMMLPTTPAPEPPAAAPDPKAKGKKAKSKAKSKKELAAEKAAADKAAAEAKAAADKAAEEKTAAEKEAAKNPLTALTGGKTGGDSIMKLIGVAQDLLTNGLSSQISYLAMEQMFGLLVDQPNTLSSVYVEVPDASNLTPELRKRVLNMAAFLVALKASGKIVDASQKDFDAAKQSYTKIMDMRQKAAAALADAYFKRNQAESLRQIDLAQGTASLRPEDEALLQGLGAATAADFTKDSRVQTLAIELLKQADPGTYGAYTMEFAEMKSHYNGYVRGMGGAAAMAAFSIIFVNDSVKMLNSQGAIGTLSFLPLVQQALPEAVALAPRLVKIYDLGDESVGGSFSIERGGKIEKQGLTAKKVYANLDDAAKAALREGMVANGPNSILGTLHFISPTVAANVADKLVSKDTKALLAKHYASDKSQFSFADAQAGKCGPPDGYKNISQALFLQRQPEPDKSCSGETGQQAIMLAQRELRDGVANMENSELRKIMLAMNQNPADASAPIVLADMRVRIDNLGLDGLIDQQSMMEERLKAHAVEMDHKDVSKGKKALKGKRK